MNIDMAHPPRKYATILADPAWSFVTRSSRGKGRSAEKHYGCMNIADIAGLPVKNVAADDCVLFMWVTDPLLPKALEVMAAWGFTYKTVAFNWAKLNRKNTATFFVGMGYWTRANPELCLLGTRGNPRRLSKAVRRLVVEPVREHSRKPDCIYDRIEALVPGPYLELFARTSHAGWDVWGNEVTKFGAGTPLVPFTTHRRAG